MALVDAQYYGLVERVLNNGEPRTDRTGVGTRGMFFEGVGLPRNSGLHLLGLKYTNFNAVKEELLWFLSGSTNINDLNSSIWDEWADDDGDVGPVYGKQWRAWYTGMDLWDEGPIETYTDQIAELIHNLKTDPHSRRHIISAWNVADLPDMHLAPCHYAMQWYVTNDGYLDLLVHQRSADLMLGVPFNLASYSLLQHMIAHVTGYHVGRYMHTFGDIHIYNNHFTGVQELMKRDIPDNNQPEVWLNPDITDIDDFKSEDIRVVGYEHHPKIKFPVAV